MVYSFNPLVDPRWTKFLENHPRSSLFHTVPWLAALQRTYAYQPVAFTTSAPGAELGDALVFCRIESRLTGRRLVSLPFSDHCDPLVESLSEAETTLLALRRELLPQKLRYVEIRPLQPFPSAGLAPCSTHTYCLHRLDLAPSLDTLFRNCHKDSTQRMIRRAGREGLACEAGASPALLDAFYRLLLLTRRRHAVPPQPKRWFQNLVDSFGTALSIRVAFHRGQPVAAILTLRHKDTLVYKYGCSDARFHYLGGMHLLFWNAVEEAKSAALRSFDLGRSDWEDSGLITFKDRWGATRSPLTYTRLLSSGDASKEFHPAASGWKGRLVKNTLPHCPVSIFRRLGDLIYKHLG